MLLESSRAVLMVAMRDGGARLTCPASTITVSQTDGCATFIRVVPCRAGKAAKWVGYYVPSRGPGGGSRKWTCGGRTPRHIDALRCRTRSRSPLAGIAPRRGLDPLATIGPVNRLQPAVGLYATGGTVSAYTEMLQTRYS